MLLALILFLLVMIYVNYKLINIFMAKGINFGDELIIVLLSGLTFIVAVAGARTWYKTAKRQAILEDGVAADGKVLNIEALTSGSKGNPLAKLTLEIELTTGELEVVHIETRIHPIYIPQFQPNKIVKLRYDKANFKKVFIDQPV